MEYVIEHIGDNSGGAFCIQKDNLRFDEMTCSRTNALLKTSSSYVNMPPHLYTVKDLFQQLGLPSDTASIEDFADQNRAVCRNLALVDAPIWTKSQLDFLREAIAEDSDWAQAADSLQLMLSK